MLEVWKCSLPRRIPELVTTSNLTELKLVTPAIWVTSLIELPIGAIQLQLPVLQILHLFLDNDEDTPFPNSVFEEAAGHHSGTEVD